MSHRHHGHERRQGGKGDPAEKPPDAREGPGRAPEDAAAPRTPPPAAEGPAEPSRGAAAPAPEDVEALRSRLAEQQELLDRLQRALADMDNRRKRAERLMDEHSRYALQSFTVDILGVIDNFNRAMKHAEETGDFDALRDGLKLVHDQLLAVLRQHHVTRIEAMGLPFDPNRHEAIAQIESAEHPEQTVIDVHQEGYQLHDRTIRPSRVVVSRKPSPDAGAEEEGGETADEGEAPDATG